MACTVHQIIMRIISGATAMDYVADIHDENQGTTYCDPWNRPNLCDAAFSGCGRATLLHDKWFVNNDRFL